MRREAQLIVPSLYLGPFQSSIRLQQMKAMGITHVCVIPCSSMSTSREEPGSGHR